MGVGSGGWGVGGGARKRGARGREEGGREEGHQHPERIEDDEHHHDHVELWILAECDAELPRMFTSLEAK